MNIWNVLLWNALCFIPITTDMAKKIYFKEI